MHGADERDCAPVAFGQAGHVSAEDQHDRRHRRQCDGGADHIAGIAMVQQDHGDDGRDGQTDNVGLPQPVPLAPARPAFGGVVVHATNVP